MAKTFPFKPTWHWTIGLACVLAWSATQAALNPPTGVNIEPDMTGRVSPGMSQSEVTAAFGQPAKVRHYGNQPGPTWIYHLLTFEVADWHVDFGPDGRVVATERRMLPLGDGSDVR